MDRELDERIRQRAYALWEQEGRPEGEDFRHWFRAVEEIRQETGQGDGPELAASNDMIHGGALETEEGPAQSQPADGLHAAALPGAAAAPAAQGAPKAAPRKKAAPATAAAAGRKKTEPAPKGAETHRKLAERYLSLGGHRRAKIDDNHVSTREWRQDPPEAAKFWDENIEKLPAGDRRQVELLLPDINSV